MVTYNFNDKMGNICSLFKYWFNSQFSQAIIKVWSTFLKIEGVGKAHKYFPVRLLEHNGKSLLKSFAA